MRTPIQRLVARLTARKDRPRLCAYGTRLGEVSESRCEAVITLRESTASGHPGYCSHWHDSLAQSDAPM